MRILPIILLLTASFSLPASTADPVAEQAKKDFIKVNQVYSAESFSVQMVYNFYYEHSSPAPAEVKTGLYYKSGLNSYSDLMGIQTIRNKSISIVIQKEDQVLVVSNPVSESSVMGLGLDTLLRFCSSITSSDVGGNQVKYELKLKLNSGLEHTQMDIYIDKSKYCVSRLVFYYKEQNIINPETGKAEKVHPKMEVVYKNFNGTAAAASPALFSESTYVTKVSANKYKGAGKYAGYKIYNQKFK